MNSTPDETTPTTDSPRPKARTAPTRGAPEPDLVLRYGNGENHLIDVHLPPGPAAPAPVLVLLHGGFWRSRVDRTHTRRLAHAFRTSGWVVATPEYSRSNVDAGVTGWPTTFDDIAAVRDRLPSLLTETVPTRVEAGAMTLLGHSAGGHLALWWALTADHSQHPARVVALAPVADLARAYTDDLGDAAVRDFLGGGPGDYPDRYTYADTAPMLADYRGPADLRVLHGAKDQQVPVEHSRELTCVSYTEIASANHFALIDPTSPAWPQLLAAVRGGD